MIDPNSINTVRVGELPPADFNLTDNLPHEISDELKRGTVQELADVIGAYLGTSDSLAFNPTTVTDGGALPETTSNEWMLVGKGTFSNVGGGDDIITTEELNALTSNGSYWSLAVQIPINVELAGITQNVRSGYTNTTPSEDAVYKAIANVLTNIGTDIDAELLLKEDTGNKQDSLTADGTGTKFPTVDAVNKALSGITVNRAFSILDDNFEDGTNSDLTLSTGWTLGSDGIAISSSGGWANSALYNKYTTIDRVSTRALIQVITTTSIFSIIRKPVGLSQFGTVAQVDLNAMRLNIYASWDGSTTVPSVAKFVAIPFTIVANRKYLVELIKNKAVSVFTFTDETNTANTISLSFNQETEGISAIGRQWTSPGIMFNSGSIKLKRFTYATTFPNAPKLLITGHSFVEGYALIDQGDVSKTYSNLMYDSLIGNVAIAGRGGETITSINTRDDINFFSPTYHLVDIGSNDTVYATWLSGIQTYIAKIIATGAIPVLATIVPRSDRQTFINQCNDWIRLSGYNYVDFAKAVTVNNDGITQDASLFWTDSVHPNIAGNAKMFQQIKIDAPYLWDGYAKPITSVANLDMVEVTKTASFSVSLADTGKLYVINSASAVVVTYPTSMTAGKWWEFLSIGTGAVSFVAGSSATLISPDNRFKLRTQFSTARIIARASNQGSLGGDIVL